MNSKHDKNKEIYTQTNHSRNGSSQRQRECFERSKRKMMHHIWETPITADLSIETMQTRRNWNDKFQELNK